MMGAMFARACALFVGLAAGACVSTDPISSGGSSGEGAGDPEGGAGGAFVTDGGAGVGGSTQAGPTCGDGLCSEGETCDGCPADCPCTDDCGDGTCDASETCVTCDADCGSCPACGDGTCSATEDCDTCYEDCGVCACVDDGLEPNDGSGAAITLALDTDYCDLSICAGDVDWFEFAVNGTTTITVNFLQAEGDLELEIYSQTTGDYVTGAYSADDDEVLTLMGQPTGMYWARVYGDDPENPDYCIRVD